MRIFFQSSRIKKKYDQLFDIQQQVANTPTSSTGVVKQNTRTLFNFVVRDAGHFTKPENVSILDRP